MEARAQVSTYCSDKLLAPALNLPAGNNGGELLFRDCC